MSTTTVPKTYALIEYSTPGGQQAPKTLATGDADYIWRIGGITPNTP